MFRVLYVGATTSHQRSSRSTLFVSIYNTTVYGSPSFQITYRLRCSGFFQWSSRQVSSLPHCPENAMTTHGQRLSLQAFQSCYDVAKIISPRHGPVQEMQVSTGTQRVLRLLINSPSLTLKHLGSPPPLHPPALSKSWFHRLYRDYRSPRKPPRPHIFRQAPKRLRRPDGLCPHRATTRPNSDRRNVQLERRIRSGRHGLGRGRCSDEGRTRSESCP